MSNAIDQAAVAVVGMGKIGLPLAMHYVRHGRRVIGCDIDPAVVATLNAGGCHVHEEPGLAEEVADAVRRSVFSAMTDTTAAACRASVVVVIVPVIIAADRSVDFAVIDAATEAIGVGLHPGTLVIYETTLPVGTTSGRLRGILERASGLTAGRDFHLAYSPERVSSGHIARDLDTYPKVVGGIDAASSEAAQAFYRGVLNAEILLMRNADEAEFVKLIETTYRDVNIALANEFARYADAHGLDMRAASRAANSQPYSHIHDPGVGVGGHCIPVYPYFLMHDESDGLALPRVARRINDGMAEYAIQHIEAVTGDLTGQVVLILGVAYRGDVKETAFTSADLLRDALTARGARVLAGDPLFTADELRSRGYEPYVPSDVQEIRAIIVQTAHRVYQNFDFRPFMRCQVVLDGRRAIDPARVTALGMRYLAIGDGTFTSSPS